MPNDIIRVLIADDHTMLCEGLRLYLSDSDLEVIGIAADGQQALEMTLELKPDVLLLAYASDPVERHRHATRVHDKRHNSCDRQPYHVRSVALTPLSQGALE